MDLLVSRSSTIVMLPWLCGYICFYISMSRRHLRPRFHSDTMIQMFSLVTQLPASSFSIIPCSVCSQAGTYEINYIDRQFFIIASNLPNQIPLSRISVWANIRLAQDSGQDLLNQIYLSKGC